MINVVLENFAKYFPEINYTLSAGLIILARVLGFIRFAPLFNRKELFSMAKIALALLIAVFLTLFLKPSAPPAGTALVYSLLLNFAFGAIIGWIAQCILIAIESGGDMINMQMGLQAAQVLDPTTSAQTSLVGKCFALIGLIVFFQIGGVYWILNAFIRSFDIFPIYATSFSLESVVNMKYLVQITSNVLYMGLQIASPILLATLGQDIILGIISKTAPQVNVFQLSFLFKPVMGAAILIWILPMLMDVINQYFITYSNIF